MDKQLKCQYVFTNTGKKGEKCNKIVRQQTNVPLQERDH
jgi:hypothetical protein